jgi:hypothetical protein
VGLVLDLRRRALFMQQHQPQTQMLHQGHAPQGHCQQPQQGGEDVKGAGSQAPSHLPTGSMSNPGSGGMRLRNSKAVTH